MNIFQWLKSKSGKLPITLAQAAGIAAVVGAAGFGAMNFLSSPADNNNTFLPPSANQGQVVYVAQGGGGGQYEANGEVGSAFKAAPSRAIQLANQQAARQAQTRALEEAAGQSTYQQPGDEVNPQMPKAYQVSNADLGLGMGSNADKQLNGSLEVFSNIQNQLAGVTQAVNNAQAGSAQAAGAAAPGNTSGQTAAQLASASRNWGNNGLTRAGGGSGSANSFVVQNSGKNADDKTAAAAVAQAGDAIAQAQAAMASMQEGTRMRSRANFGRSEGLGQDKDAAAQRARRFGKGRDELSFIRKQTAAINANKTNAANEGGNPFLASTKISGGLTVSGDNVTTGTGSSGDLRSTTDTQLKGIKGGLGNIESQLEQRTRDRHDLRKWMWIALPLALGSLPLISYFVFRGNIALTPWSKIFWYALAAVLSASVLLCLGKLVGAANNYANSYGSTLGSGGGDFASNFAKYLGYLLMGGVGLAWVSPLTMINWINLAPWTIGGIAAAVGFGGAATYSWLSHNGEGSEYDDNSNTDDLDTRTEDLKTGGGQNK